MTDTLLRSMQQRLRAARRQLDQAQREERKARARLERVHWREDIEPYAEAVRASTEAACDAASLVMAVTVLERLET